MQDEPLLVGWGANVPKRKVLKIRKRSKEKKDRVWCGWVFVAVFSLVHFVVVLEAEFCEPTKKKESLSNSRVAHTTHTQRQRQQRRRREGEMAGLHDDALSVAAVAVALALVIVGVQTPGTELVYLTAAGAAFAAAVFFWYRSQNGMQTLGGEDGDKNRRESAEHTFHVIRDKYTSTREVSDAIRESGLESCNLIIGIDYTKSNDFQGQKTFGGKSLHHVDPTGEIENPYQQVRV